MAKMDKMRRALSYGRERTEHVARNQQKANPAFGWRRTLLYPVQGPLYGQFARRELNHLSEINAGRGCDERAQADIRGADRVVMSMSHACRWPPAVRFLSLCQQRCPTATSFPRTRANLGIGSRSTTKLRSQTKGRS